MAENMIAFVAASAGLIHDFHQLLSSCRRWKSLRADGLEAIARLRDCAIEVEEQLATIEQNKKLLTTRAFQPPLKPHDGHILCSAHIAANELRNRDPSRRYDTANRTIPVVLLNTCCLIVTKIALPPLQWLCVHSLHLEPDSQMDRKILRAIPSLASCLEMLKKSPSISIIAVLTLSATSVIALWIPMSAQRIDATSGKTSVHREVWSLAVLCFIALCWNHEGGSPLDFFLLGLPVALSIGISLGSLCENCQLSKLCRLGQC